VPLMAMEELDGLLACPVCRSPLERRADGYVCSADACRRHANPFPFVGTVPVLVDFDRSVFDEAGVLGRDGESILPRRRGVVYTSVKRLLAPRNRVAERSMRRLLGLMGGQSSAPVVLVVGGGAIGSGLDWLYRNSAAAIVGFDVYASPLVQIVADGHMIPLGDATVDAAVVQAVLQHVVDPSQVVNEIHRVLKDNGVVYAETAFMQQVCEGPYDFARFSESGHRYLFRMFDVIESGAVSGPGTQLLWSIDYFARGLFRSRVAGRMARAAFCWLSLLDRVFTEPYAVDDAPSVYFLGRRRLTELTPREVICHYKGAQRIAPGREGAP
jgi:SAM-dependent methyltransferase